MNRSSMFLSVSLGLTSVLALSHPAGATSPAGPDILHVPMSWSSIVGSPAQAAPNIAGDTDTDAVLWRRHERPTDNIWTPQSAISLRSGINSIWGTGLSFPTISDTDMTFGNPGDVLADATSIMNNTSVEFNTAITNARNAWANLSPPDSANIGITAINANRFHDTGGSYVGIIGWGGCAKVNPNSTTCSAPYNAIVMSIDNTYLFAGTGNNLYGYTDPFDQLVGHEVGHALGLQHRNSSAALMNPSQVTTANQVSNIGLNATEVNDARNNAMIVNGLEIDPPGVFNPGPVLVAEKMDRVREGAAAPLPMHLDLASSVVALDRRQDEVIFEQRLLGRIPRLDEGQSVEYWSFVNADNDTKTGAPPELLGQIGAPQTAMEGTELALRVRVYGQDGPQLGVEPMGWELSDGIQPISSDLFRAELPQLFLHPQYAAGVTPPDHKEDEFSINHNIKVVLPNNELLVPYDLDQPFTLEAVIASTGGEMVYDRLGDESTPAGTPFVLREPVFPHCFPQDDPTEPGGSVLVRIEDLDPDAPIHILFGPTVVAQGMTDANGDALVSVPIPEDARPGLHLITAGPDGTALTCDCHVRVIPEPTSLVLFALGAVFLHRWRRVGTAQGEVVLNS